MEKCDLIENSIALLKSKGFKKKNLTWTLDSSETIACYNIQTSQWDSKDFYVNIGIVVKNIEQNPSTRLGTWHFSTRVSTNNKNCEMVITEAINWLNHYAQMDNIVKYAKVHDYENPLMIATLQAVNFLREL